MNETAEECVHRMVEVEWIAELKNGGGTVQGGGCTSCCVAMVRLVYPRMKTRWVPVVAVG